MIKLDVDDRLSAWSNLRKQIDDGREDPFQILLDFWNNVPFVPHNHNIDPYYQASWPTPWEVIVENKYDDFTKSVMIGWTLLLTDRFKNSTIEVRTFIDNNQNRLYNVVYVDGYWVLNYHDSQVVTVDKVSSLYSLENLVELKRPR